MQYELPISFESGTDSDGLSSKTSPDSSAPTKEETLLMWLERSLGPHSTYRETGGRTPELSSARTDSPSGACWTANIGARRNPDVGYSLSSILETGKIDDRYYLTPIEMVSQLKREIRHPRGWQQPKALMAFATGLVTAIQAQLKQHPDLSFSEEQRRLFGTDEEG